MVGSARILLVAAAGMVVTGCGTLDHHELAAGQFNVWGDGAYAHDSDLQREAMRVCPSGFTKVSVYDGPENADVARIIRWHIACNENSK
jgi:hypothetical protein